MSENKTAIVFGASGVGLAMSMALSRQMHEHEHVIVIQAQEPMDHSFLDEEKPIRRNLDCDFCDRKFKTMDGLTRHTANKHQTSVSETIEEGELRRSKKYAAQDVADYAEAAKIMQTSVSDKKSGLTGEG